MRQDQFERLLVLQEKIGDVVLVDANPENWTGNGALPKDLTKAERGDAYWCRKQAMATLSLLMRVVTLTGQLQHANAPPPPAAGQTPDESVGLLDKEIADAEAEAGKLLDRVSRAAAKGAFVARAVNDKP